MADPKLRKAVGFVLALCLADCSPAPRKPPEAPAPAADLAAATQATELPVIGRTDILAAAAAVSDAFASGGEYPSAGEAIIGRRFALKLPFGCVGPNADAALGYSYDLSRQTIRISAKPQEWLDLPWAASLFGGSETEAIEGFWLRRPWMTGEACPRGPTGSDGTPSAEVLGLAQVFDREGSRLQQRSGRPYEVTRRIDSQEAPGPQGYRLVLEGRVVGSEGLRPVLCSASSPDERPVCLVRVEFDRVAFETPGGAMLAEWRS